MIDLSKYTDLYERKARLYPALICLFPIILGVAISYPKVFSTLSGFVAIAAAVGLLQLLSNLARDRGKSIEIILFKKWGGIPSVTIFRHRDKRISRPAKLKYHALLSETSNIIGPSEDDEIRQPTECDEIYLSWSDYLRGKTRDTKKYNMLFNENINYGFRRNLLGLKWTCIFFTIIGAGILYIPVLNGSNMTEIIIATSIFFLFYIFVFYFLVTPQWVKTVADAYGKQLIESVNI